LDYFLHSMSENEENEAIVAITEENPVSPPATKKIKHLVISGGGTIGFMFYGALKESHQRGIWNMADIKTIHATSAGSVVSTFLALQFDWKTIDDYIIKRPWQNVFQFNMSHILSSFHERGILDVRVMNQMFQPLFSAKDISLDVTMEEFYQRTGVELHIFVTNINTIELVDISYKTHPDWRLIEAIYCSCALPIIFKPMVKGGSCYCDGGFIRNYPIKECIDSGADPDEIFGLCKYSRIDPSGNIVGEESSIFDYLFSIVCKIFLVHLCPKFVPIKYQLTLEVAMTSLNDYFRSANCSAERTRLIELGKDAFLKKYGGSQEEDKGKDPIHSKSS